ncbi:MAG: hypothetical protein GC192_00125 [Bacteroidetes bacterium]|nr:hypothetical protein [Bacteroidota bacterium]
MDSLPAELVREVSNYKTLGFDTQELTRFLENSTETQFEELLLAMDKLAGQNLLIVDNLNTFADVSDAAKHAHLPSTPRWKTLLQGNTTIVLHVIMWAQWRLI